MKALQLLIESAGYEARSYSGRGMYGKQCLAVDVGPNLFAFVADLVTAVGEMGVSDLCEVLAEALRKAKADSLGCGTIVYWPNEDFDPDGDLEELGDA